MLIRIIFSCLLATLMVNANELHKVTIGADIPFIEGKHFEQGTNVSPQNDSITLNNFYVKENGTPILPVMGEIHYTRIPRNEWEEALLKMKSAGISIVAIYNFWIHHEEEEGKFRFDGNRDVRHFINLCAKHGLRVFVRIGPWFHGEARNGGYPDWFQLKINRKRVYHLDEVTTPYIKRFYSKLAEQFEGLYYKDGGPIVALQVDNEVRAGSPNSSGYKYLVGLKKMARELGMDVPLYSATGWSGAVPENDMMPTYGGYPAAPWHGSSKPLKPLSNYLFKSDRRDPNVGADLGLNAGEGEQTPIYKHPYFTVEMGGGNQISYHRRPVLQGEDMLALVYTRLGVGANSMGYYVFHGTQHPISDNGKYTTEESKSTIYAYPNDYPKISYDFLAPLTEWGYMRDYYHDFKLAHLFLNNFAEELAPMYPVIPADNPTKPADTTSLRYSVRSRSGAGFVFVNNYARHQNMVKHEDVQFVLELENETIVLPENGMTINSDVYGAFPFNLDLNGVLLKYATVHPFAKLDDNKWFFYSIPNCKAELKLDAKGIKKVSVSGADKKMNNDAWYIYGSDDEFSCKITMEDGTQCQINVVTEAKALTAYQFKLKGKTHMLFSDKLVMNDEVKEELEFRSEGDEQFNFSVYPDINISAEYLRKGRIKNGFRTYQVNMPKWESKEVGYEQITNKKAFETYAWSLRNTPSSPDYSHIYEPKKLYLTYQLNIPEDLLEDIYDVKLSFDYRGNTGMIYANDTLVADDFYSGLEMPFGCRRNADKLKNGDVKFRISPLMGKYHIYFEKDTDLEFAKKKYGELIGVTTTPVYQFRISY